MTSNQRIEDAQHIIKLIEVWRLGDCTDEINARATKLFLETIGFVCPQYMSSMDVLFLCVPDGWCWTIGTRKIQEGQEMALLSKYDQGTYKCLHLCQAHHSYSMHAAFLTAILMAYIKEWKGVKPEQA